MLMLPPFDEVDAAAPSARLPKREAAARKTSPSGKSCKNPRFDRGVGSTDFKNVESAPGDSRKKDWPQKGTEITEKDNDRVKVAAPSGSLCPLCSFVACPQS